MTHKEKLEVVEIEIVTLIPFLTGNYQKNMQAALKHLREVMAALSHGHLDP